MWIEQDLYNEIISLIPIICVDVAIVYDNKILLIKRGVEPAAGEWWLPGGRLYKGETLEACALRKAKEETGLECGLGPVIHCASTDFGTIHSVNFCWLLLARNDRVKLDNTCLDYRWTGSGELAVESKNIDSLVHSYVFRCVSKAFDWLEVGLSIFEVDNGNISS